MTMESTASLGSILANISAELIARDTALVVRAESVTGNERPALEAIASIATDLELECELIEFDLTALRTQPGYPGSVAARESLWGLGVTLRGLDPDAARFLLNGHVDVVSPGPLPWAISPWSGTIEGGRVYGRGSVDMKGGLVAALHAMGAMRRAAVALRGDVVLHAVSSEEDGGQGTFAMLGQDANFSGCIIPEPTGLQIACAHAGFLQFRGTIHGVSAHAATRRAGVSALDVYQRVHLALQEFELRENERVASPLMRELELPYPVVVGRIEGGRWASQVPDQLTFEGRVGIPVGSSGDAVWTRFRGSIGAAVAIESAASIELEVLSLCEPGETPSDGPLATLAREALGAEVGERRVVVGVPWGADMREVVRRGVPCIMVGPTGIERTHAVDEWVDIEELATVSRVIARTLVAADGVACGREASTNGRSR